MKRFCCVLTVFLIGLSTSCSENRQSVIEPDFGRRPSISTGPVSMDTVVYTYDTRARYWHEESCPPSLSAGEVSPSSGTTWATYEYTVHYHDPDGDPPTMIQVHIDGTPHDMVLAAGAAHNGTYVYTTALAGGNGYMYFFHCADGQDYPARLPQQGFYDGPDVEGTNPHARVAVHVLPHASRSCTKGFPVIDNCGDFVTTEPGPDADCFPVFYYLTEYQGFDYALTWPGMYSCVFTSCSDVTIGGIVWPGDGISQTWDTCRSGWAAVTGWAWIVDYGLVCVAPHPDLGSINVRDCHDPPGIDHPDYSVCAGLGGVAGDEACW
jgi:hypothetical protein